MGPLLIVDDEPAIAEVLSDLLTDEGYRTAVARNGREALALMQAERPQLVLLDYMMPVMNGAAVLEAMKADEALRDVPVILMSANAPAEWRSRPDVPFLGKPFSIDTLLELLGRLAPLTR